MTDDQFAVIERDDDGIPKVRRMLDPREVSTVRGPDGDVCGYLWEPVKPQDPDWRLDPLLIECPCRHCRAGRMCRDMADLFRRCARQDGDMISELRGRR